MVCFPDDIWRKIINNKSHLEWLDLKHDAILYDRFYKNDKDKSKNEWKETITKIYKPQFGSRYIGEECRYCKIRFYYGVGDCYCRIYTYQWKNILDNINSARIKNGKYNTLDRYSSRRYL